MEQARIGFALCGSFCTWSKAMEVLARLAGRYETVVPIVSERGAEPTPALAGRRIFWRGWRACAAGRP